MSKLNVDQKTIKELFMDRKADFLIPDYQRPYAWEEKECQTLWEDIFAFAFPDDHYSKFDSDNEEYYLGSVVTFKNEQGKIYKINPICKHLGCELVWNNLDKTWDCPCHGSRYDYKGKLIYGPSVKDL